MLTFQLYSDKLNCELQFKFDLNGRIIGFEIQGMNTLGGDELNKFLAYLPQTVGELKQHCQKRKIALTEVKPDLTFTTFWNRYNYKDGGSKKKAEDKWSRMSEADRTKAMNYLPRYESALVRQGVAKAYATTYLNDRRWDN